MYNRWLCHYGVKGMKWGVRKRKTTYGDEVYVKSTLTQQERDQYDGFVTSSTDYTSKRAKKREHFETKFYKEQIKREHKNPDRYKIDRKSEPFSTTLLDKDGKAMGFIIGQDSKTWRDQERYINVAIAITKKYQGTYVSKRLVDEGKKWFEKHPEYSEMRWYAVKDNKRSQRLAEKSGFERAPQYDNTWDVVYSYKHKSKEQ